MKTILKNKASVDKTLTISSKKDWILIDDPNNPMGGTIFENSRSNKKTSEYVQSFLKENL